MRTFKITILTIIFLLLFAVTCFAKTGTITASSLILRKEPSSQGEVLLGINKDEQVEIVEKTDDKWYKVKYKENIGYISAEYVQVEEEKPEETSTPLPETTEKPTETHITTTEPENMNAEQELKTAKTLSESDVYILPVINSSIINKLEENKEVNVIKKINKWAYVESNSVYGWIIYGKLISNEVASTPIPEETPTPMPETTPEPIVTPVTTPEPKKTTEEVAYINVSTFANLRETPSTDAKVLDTLQRNMQVTVLSEENGWSKIKVKGIIGYISKELVSDTKLEEIDTTSRSLQEERTTENAELSVQATINGSSVVDLAKKYLGYNYVLGGTTPSGGFDCSGFVYYVFGKLGKSISRSLSTQATTGAEVAKANLEPGDIVIFNDGSNSSLGHVGIYVGDNQFIHAANPKRGVVIDYLDSRNSYYNERYVTSRRI